MMNMKLLAVVTPPSIYHGCYTRKMFWEGDFTGEENFTLGEFSAVNMKNCGHRNVDKQRYIKDSDKYITLDISLNFGSLESIRITSSDPKYSLVRSGKALINSLDIKDKTRTKNTKTKVCHQKYQYEGIFKDYQGV